MTDEQLSRQIAAELSISTSQVGKVAEMIDQGATIPFIARYRQEQTGGLDEEQLRSVRDRLEYRRLLEERKQTVRNTIDEQGKLSDELDRAIQACTDFKKLEDLYLPYKPKRKTRATVAREKGLEPLATVIWEQQTTRGTPEEHAAGFVDADQQVNSVEEALQGARDICAEWVNEHTTVRDRLRSQINNHAALVVKKQKSAEDEKRVFESYYDFRTKLKGLRAHQILAINRGEREQVLQVEIDVWEEKALEIIDRVIIANDNSVFIEHLEDAIQDSWKRLLFPALSREVRSELTERADEHAIETFARNLHSLLMQPPLASRVVLGIDPGYRTGCKVAVVGRTGDYLESDTIYPTQPFNRTGEAARTLNRLIDRHGVQLIAVGNGTASRETEQFVAGMLRDRRENNESEELKYLLVDESGASVYSTDKEARREFPDLDASQRGTISIARRVQDPLAELVKIDPRSIGVGLYQHDVSQSRLSRKLDDVVESCVNSVGVNLNTASEILLAYVSGLSRTTGQNITAKRQEIGGFTNRKQLKEVPGVGAFRFEQAAGFLRIPESETPLDNTAIHPESYPATRKLCEQLGINLDQLSGELNRIPEKLEGLDREATAESIGVGVPTLDLIIENLKKPGRDPREDLPRPILRDDVMSMEDLRENQQLQGTVRNVVDFGAFVDIGVKQDGLIHISNLSAGNRRVHSPHDEVRVGDIVTVEIQSVEAERGRIGLRRIE